MRIFDYFFNRYGIPLLVVGSTGTGIKLYFGKTGNLYFVDSDSLNSGDKVNPDLPIADTPSIPATVLQPAKRKVVTFSEKIDNKRFKVFTQDTKKEVIRNAMFQRLYPNKDDHFSYSENQLFTGGVVFDFNAKTFESKDKTKHLKTIAKPDEGKIEEFRNACLQALQKEYPEDEEEKNKNQVAKLREWCTEPKIKDVLSRHKFHVFSDNNYKDKVDESIKQIIFSWFKAEGDKKWWTKQSFLDEEDVKKILAGKEDKGFSDASEINGDHIKVVKDKCLKTLEKEFERENFYLTKDFIDQMDGKPDEKPKVDLFQEVALFCSVPTTAEDYVKNAMQGNFKEDFEEKDKDDYCYVEGKKPEDYKKISTTDPFEGKTFWCAVRLLYKTNNPPKKP
ncbi:hypothetical protein [Candidatus Mycoplasma haematohominis]|uniref:Uncharacterized protein n=1 Tax=Candidatus Mycoplasma haematohominis TaxID=1494318 RepID=A0A478FR40_9MOLU|nr:hypothetical protein [Candidatus Mycoplasma haemohominis]GCE63882.1 hypothetical protein MHSWG343_08890 [Candidatus Mycoplasma haemohominis]